MKIDQIKFGSIVIEGQRYGDVLIVDGEVKERDKDSLEKEFGTAHKISGLEGDKLLEADPEYIIIGNGFSGALEVQPEISEKLKNSGAKIEILHSPIAARKYNDLVREGRGVNALIHSTC